MVHMISDLEADARRLWWRFVMAGLLPLEAKAWEYLPEQRRQELMDLTAMLHGKR